LLERKRRLSHDVLAPVAASSKDMQDLFEGSTAVPSTRADLEGIGTMEPLEFEDWVLEELRSAGYRVERTPTTHDGGADGVAHPPQPGDQTTLVIQCKHTESDRPCGVDAVDEIVAAESRYSLPAPVALLVVTNAPSFTRSAVKRAKEAGVLIVAAPELPKLRRIW